MNCPQISIVTPSYNQGSFLEHTIHSVLSQGYPNLEYIIIDGGSTDNSLDVIRKYESSLAYWVSEPDQGQAHAINKGWERSTGDIVAWLNSDDTFLPGTLSKVAKFFQEHPEVDILYGDTLFTEADGTLTVRSDPQDAFDYYRFVVTCHNTIPQPSAFIRRCVLDDVGLLDPHYYFFMDWDFWLRAGIGHPIVFLPEPFSTYRIHPNSKSVSQARRAAPELEYMYGKYFARNDVPDDIRRQQRTAMMNMYFTSATYYLDGGARSLAARMGLNALRVSPGLVFSPHRVHQLLYCFFAGFSFYDGGRKVYSRLRPKQQSISERSTSG